MNPETRIVYRAFADALVASEDRPNRSAEAYADFVTAPIHEAFEERSPIWTLGDSKYSHVVATDLAAFYQYIDHSILRDELDLNGRDIDLIDSLTAFLVEIEGRGFGIPQQSEPSDWLSDLVAARLERAVLRGGFDVWRYSDDFRIGCRSYSEALSAIEFLSRAARDLGLVLNDQKTSTPTWFTYLVRNVNIEVDNPSAQIDPSDVEAAAIPSDYPPESDDEALEGALSTVQLLWDPESNDRPRPDEAWDLRSLTSDQHRMVRRALNTLTVFGDDTAMPILLSIIAFQPAMTHRVVQYAVAVSTTDLPTVDDFFNKVIRRISLTEWQRAWVAHGLGASGVSLRPRRDPRVTWLRDRIAAAANSLSASEAVVTLAGAGLVDFSQVDEWLRVVSQDFAPWYLQAFAILRNSGTIPMQRIDALRGSSIVADALLSE